MSARRACAWVASWLLGCGGGGAAQTSGTSDTTGGSADHCDASSACEMAFCVASWDADARMRGPAECVPECVAPDDLARFCIDDAACCAGSTCNKADGLCAEIDVGTSSGSSGSTSTSTADTSSTGDASSSSSTGDASSSSSTGDASSSSSTG